MRLKLKTYLVFISRFLIHSASLLTETLVKGSRFLLFGYTKPKNACSCDCVPSRIQRGMQYLGHNIQHIVSKFWQCKLDSTLLLPKNHCENLLTRTVQEVFINTQTITLTYFAWPPRAGRCQPGVCYHLFSRIRYEDLQEYPDPELLRYPLQELCLHTKLLAAPNTSIADFLAKAPEPPAFLITRNAVHILKVSFYKTDIIFEGLSVAAGTVQQIDIFPAWNPTVIYLVNWCLWTVWEYDSLSSLCWSSCRTKGL